MSKNLLTFLFLWMLQNCFAQLPSMIQNPADIHFIPGKNTGNWMCTANFTLSDKDNLGRIKFLEFDQVGNLYVIDNNGYLYALSYKNLDERWKVHLGHEAIQDFKVSPNGKTLSICYNYIKTATKKLEIRRTLNGSILLKIKQKPECYDNNYFLDVIEQTTLYPFKSVYAPDGNSLAVWFKNHGFDENKCKARYEEKLIILDPENGELIAQRNQIPLDLKTPSCDHIPTITFDPQGDKILIGSCEGKIAIYSADQLQLLQTYSILDFIEPTKELNLNFAKKQISKINDLIYLNNDQIVLSLNKLKNHFIWNLKDNSMDPILLSDHIESGRLILAQNLDYSMLNNESMHLIDNKDGKLLFSIELSRTNPVLTAKFHPQKEAIILGTKRTLKLFSKGIKKQIQLSENFEKSGLFLSAETDFCVQGKGKIFWAFDEQEIVNKKDNSDLIFTEIGGFGNLYNNKYNIKDIKSLKLKTDSPGVFDLYGAYTSKVSCQELYQKLNPWK